MATRAQILDALWGGALPREAPEVVVETYLAGGQIALHPSSIGRCKQLRFALAGGMWSTVFVYWPATTTGQRSAALIWHAGHESDWSEMWTTVGAALARGYVVAEIRMPLYWTQDGSYYQWSPVPYTLSGGAQITVTAHDDFATVDAAGGTSWRVYLDPVFRVAAYLRSYHVGATRVGLAGHSGGGWTALIAGALDTTIDLVASVHGWCPRGAAGEPVRDYEQTAAWLLANRGMTYEDYSAMIGTRRQLICTGSSDPVFGAGVLGQAAIDAMVAGIQARGANLAQQTFTAPDHYTTAAEATWICDQMDALGSPRFVAPRWTGALTTATDLARIATTLAGYPRDGTLAYAAVDAGGGNGRIDLATQDLERLYDAAQVATLSGADQAVVLAQRGAFVGRA